MEIKEKNTNKAVNEVADNKTCQLIIFKLGNEEYCAEIHQIKEVVSTPKVTRIPLTPSYIKGVANIRGNILAIVDLEDRFNLAELDVDKKSNFTLVVESEEHKMGILVKEVPNTLTVKESEIDKSSGFVQEGSGEKNYLKGIIKRGDRIMILIDLHKVISKEEIAGAMLT